MNSEPLIGCSAIVILMLFITLFVVIGQKDRLKQQAVERGCAEWIVKSNGETTWQWKEDAK